MKILFVDDDSDVANLVKIRFKNHSLTHVFTCAEALEQIRHGDYEVIIFDFFMQFDGAMMVKLANGRLNGKKVFFFSAHDSDEIWKKCELIKHKITGVFKKDDLDGLFNAIERKAVSV